MGTPLRRIDCHQHAWELETLANVATNAAQIDCAAVNLVSCIDQKQANANPPAFVAKALFPEQVYVFAGLDHSAYFSEGRLETPSLAEQIDRLLALGADGIKMLENKPTARKMLDIPVDSPYFAEYFAHAEETGVPILWHVADPEEFWRPETTPVWARERGWGYNDTFVAKEQLYAEVENVLTRHPNLRIIFAHFYFLSADPDRAARLFDRFPGVHLDLAPGIELLYNLSRNPDASRRFFERYQDRILFGTDISSNQPATEAALRAGIVTRWLETSEEYRVPDGADFLLGPPEDGVMRGLALPADTLAAIYHDNFTRLAGPRPKTLNLPLAIAECERLAAEAAFLTGEPAESTLTAQAAERLRALA